MWIHRTFWLALRNGEVDSVSAFEQGAREQSDNVLRCDAGDEWVLGTLRPMLLVETLLEHRWESSENCCSCGVRLELDPRFRAYDLWLGHILSVQPDRRSSSVAKWFWQVRHAMQPERKTEQEFTAASNLSSPLDIGAERMPAAETAA